MEDEKKGEAVYDPVAQKKWEEKNKDRRKYLSHKARYRTFLRDVAKKEDLEEMQKIIDERKRGI